MSKLRDGNQKLMDMMNEMKARMDLELHCDGLFSFITMDRDSLISGNLPKGISFRKVGADKTSTAMSAPSGKVIAECAKKAVSSFLSMNGSISTAMFWQTGDPPSLRGGNLSMLFPKGKDLVIKDLLTLLEKSFYLQPKKQELTKGELSHNEELLNDIENQVGWIYLLNRQASNKIAYNFDPDGEFCIDLEELIEGTNVLGRHSEPKKKYS